MPEPIIKPYQFIIGYIITVTLSIAPAFIAYGNAKSDIVNLQLQMNDLKKRQEIFDQINTRLSRIEGKLGVKYESSTR